MADKFDDTLSFSSFRKFRVGEGEKGLGVFAVIQRELEGVEHKLCKWEGLCGVTLQHYRA